MFTWSESCCLFGVFSLVVARHYFGTLTLGCSSAVVWCSLAFSSSSSPSVSHRVSLPLLFSSHRGRLDVSGWPCFRSWHKVPGTALWSSHRAGGEVRLPHREGVWKYSVYLFLKRTNLRNPSLHTVVLQKLYTSGLILLQTDRLLTPNVIFVFIFSRLTLS